MSLLRSSPNEPRSSSQPDLSTVLCKESKITTRKRRLPDHCECKQEVLDLRLEITRMSTLLEQFIATQKQTMDMMQNSISDISNDLSNKQSTSTLVLEQGVLQTQLVERRKNSHLETKLNVQHQLDRMNNIEIKGIPAKKSENLIELVARIGEVIGQPVLPRTMYQNSHFIEHKPIIVGFTRRYLKENFVATARSYKTLSTDQIGFNGTP
ncbi:unnamed protein product [Leptosia nina]|uniref:Uncharacterized protein n=1 Tax=Leptosia nina TaxID=320188 RepID=A0AAV1JFH7_9NEOP